jgi:hypothetical protein
MISLDHCVITQNKARFGGGIFNLNGAVMMNTTTMNDNQATDSSGAIYNYGSGGGGSLDIYDSTFNRNLTTGGSGRSGAVENHGGIATFTNCTFFDNSAFDAGVIYNDGVGANSRITLLDCTVSENNTSDPASANIVNVAVNGGTAHFTAGSSIFKTGAQGPNFLNSGGTFISEGYNLSNDAAGGGGGTDPFGYLNANGDVRNTDPLLGTLASNGGPTPTIELLSGSPAIDTGEHLAPMQDQRYYRRSGPADKGAFEFNGVLAPAFVVSRKTQGALTFDIGMPLASLLGIECRSGGATNDYSLVAVFETPVSIKGYAVTIGTGTAVQLDNDGRGQLTVHLTGVSNAQRITITLFGVSDGVHTQDVAMPMGILIGDTSGNGSVNASDISETKSRSGQTVNATNFRNDVSVNGSINASDVSLVKSRTGTALP